MENKGYLYINHDDKTQILEGLISLDLVLARFPKIGRVLTQRDTFLLDNLGNAVAVMPTKPDSEIPIRIGGSNDIAFCNVYRILERIEKSSSLRELESVDRPAFLTILKITNSLRLSIGLVSSATSNELAMAI
jgi:hypothetical protein